MRVTCTAIDSSHSACTVLAGLWLRSEFTTTIGSPAKPPVFILVTDTVYGLKTIANIRYLDSISNNTVHVSQKLSTTLRISPGSELELQPIGDIVEARMPVLVTPVLQDGDTHVYPFKEHASMCRFARDMLLGEVISDHVITCVEWFNRQQQLLFRVELPTESTFLRITLNTPLHFTDARPLGKEEWRVPSLNEWQHKVSAELCGLDNAIRQLLQWLHTTLSFHEHHRMRSVAVLQSATPRCPLPHAVLIAGQAGTGKTQLAAAIARHSSLPWRAVNAPDLFRTNYGETEAALQTLFDEALRLAPSLVVLDELDALGGSGSSSSRSPAGLIERRVVSLLGSLLDRLHEAPASATPVCVLAVTSHPAALAPSLRRAGRFSHVVELVPPDMAGRAAILGKLLGSMALAEEGGSASRAELALQLAQRTPGFVGADLVAVCAEAAMAAARRSDVRRGVAREDFETAVACARPAAVTAAFGEGGVDSEVAELAGVDEQLRELEAAMVANSDEHAMAQLAAWGLHPARGVLLYGPPGTGKTALAVMAARRARVNLVAVRGTDIVNKVAGESERTLAGVFRRARAAAPCVVFLDQVEALARRRVFATAGDHVADRLLSALLVEMDGLASGGAGGVLVVAATSAPLAMLDPAVLRPGRLGVHIELKHPDLAARKAIMRSKLLRMPLEHGVAVDDVAQALAEQTAGLTGADLDNVCREAAMRCLQECMAANRDTREAVVQRHHLEAALKAIYRRSAVQQ